MEWFNLIPFCCENQEQDDFMCPKTVRNDPTPSKSAPQTRLARAPKHPKITSRRPQDVPRTAQDAARSAKDAFKTAQNASKTWLGQRIAETKAQSIAKFNNIICIELKILLGARAVPNYLPHDISGNIHTILKKKNIPLRFLF